MFTRALKLPIKRSFFLFGARSTGKSTLLKSSFQESEAHFIDLLLPSVEERFSRRPQDLLAELAALAPSIQWVVLDEVQKVPKLLDVVHHVMENTDQKISFALTGSSGRKLRRGGANLLGGRAFVYDLFPLIAQEYGSDFVLDDVLAWGSLPIISQLTPPHERFEFLTSYVRLYLSEEIQKEQVVRNLEPFRHFLELAAQYNGKIINHSSLAKSIGVDPKTVASYYQVLEDTLLGTFLLPFSRSFRKKLIKSPKFYFFDIGVSRAMARQLTVPMVTSTSYYGDVFEHFIFTQMRALFSYQRNEYRLSYYHDENNIEVDFVIERPGKPVLFVEVKSAEIVVESMTKSLRIVARDFADADFQLWSRDSVAKQYGGVTCVPWHRGISALMSDP